MNTLRTHQCKTEVIIIAAVVLSSLAGCGLLPHRAAVANTPVANTQAPAANTNVAAAPAATRRSASHAPARPSQTHASSAPAAPDKGDTKAVLSQIHQANLIEIALGKMAEEKASTNEVRAYADQLVQDHMSADQTVVAMAQKRSANLRNGAASHREGRHDIAHEKQLERKLKSASGPDFDRLFLQQASSDHERLIYKLQQDREDASDDELEALIDKMIPILEQHRELAQILMKKEQT